MSVKLNAFFKGKVKGKVRMVMVVILHTCVFVKQGYFSARMVASISFVTRQADRMGMI